MKQLLAIFALLLSSLPALAQNNAAAQANAIRPGDNLVLENIPAIPAAIAEKAFRYSEVRAASLEDRCSVSATFQKQVFLRHQCLAIVPVAVVMPVAVVNAL